MWVNNQTWCSWHVKAFTVVTKRPYHPGACNICLLTAYFRLISNGANAKIKTKQLLIYKFVLNWKVPALHIVTMKLFKLTKKIRAPRYLIATSLMINSSSIFCKLFDWIKLFNYNFIKIVNSLEYFYWKKYSLFCHIAELGTFYTSLASLHRVLSPLVDINRQFRICHSSTVIRSHFRKLFTLCMPRYKNTFEVSGILFLSIY